MAAMATSVWLSLVCTVSSEIMSPGSATRSMEEAAGFGAVWVVGAAVAAGAVTAGAGCGGAAATCVGGWGGWVGAGAAAGADGAGWQAASRPTAAPPRTCKTPRRLNLSRLDLASDMECMFLSQLSGPDRDVER